MAIGIEKVCLYMPPACIDAVQLGELRGRDGAQIRDQVMIEQRSVMPPYEDPVTMAVNASRMLPIEERRRIGLLIVGSESAVDHGKPISSWVHRFAELPSNCRNFDLKHACYSGTGALKMALAWLTSGTSQDKKALVINSDFTTPGARRLGADFIGGACAVALLVSHSPQILQVDPARAGYWTREIADTFRPTSRTEMGDNEMSLFSYLDALDGAFDHFMVVAGNVDYSSCFKNHIYHAPFPGMAFRAHTSLLSRWDSGGKAGKRESFRQKVDPGLRYAKRIGGAYGSSNFVSLLGLLHNGLAPGDRISLFAYGSGCQGEFYEGTAGENASEIAADHVEKQLAQRVNLSLDDYETVEDERDKLLDSSDFTPDIGLANGLFESSYRGRGLLVLRRIEKYRRAYEWS